MQTRKELATVGSTDREFFSVQQPATGSRLVTCAVETILFGQPPDIVKGLLSRGITRFDTLVLPDTRERDGSLLNHLEFPLYSFLFVSRGLSEGRKLNLVGDPDAISQALRLLRITLNGPIAAELERWNCDPELKSDWLKVSRDLALKDPSGEVIPVERLFNLLPFDNDHVQTPGVAIQRLSPDCFEITSRGDSVVVDLNNDERILAPYPVVPDYIASGLSKFGIEVLGGASGFSTTEPCSGLVLCFNGDYLLIDSIPFLNQLLVARGIAKNQISALFLTHLHDDHCAMFPLMEMPHRVEVITTREIFNMAMEKLACGLGWQPAVVAEHFELVEVQPGQSINYFGLNIEVHTTVHSIPTIGATFSTPHRGRMRDVCIVGDNQNMARVEQMLKSGIVRESTVENLRRLYHQHFNLLIADGGAGDIHGDPQDALQSQSDRVVFVHVEDVPETLKATFSVVSSGKRYNLIDGDDSVYLIQASRFLSRWLGQTIPNRWLNNLLIEQEIARYNAEDVMLVQGSSSRGAVYLILTGYCDVVRMDQQKRHTVARLQAGDVIGEMAVLSGTGVRNASVIARSPVTVCVFEEQTFGNFIQHSGLEDTLKICWQVRPMVKSLPQFAALSPTVVDSIAVAATVVELAAGETYRGSASSCAILVEGRASADDQPAEAVVAGDEFGWRPHRAARMASVNASSPCTLLQLDGENLARLISDCPQLNYHTRKHLQASCVSEVDWLLGEVPLHQPIDG